jgi:TPR repeat protein
MSTASRPVGRSHRAARIAAAFVLLMLLSLPIAAQRRIDSPVFRTYRPPRQQPPPQNPDPEQQWRDLTLIREANAGDKFAQHELGLRYLFGDGFVADTARGALWIGKAAEQGLVQANYNYALLLGNGMGVEWNPFESARRLKYAAERGMAEAQHNYGLLYTDDLVYPRDWKEAYRWVKLAADSGYAPAREAAAELIRRGFLGDDPGSGQSSGTAAPDRGRGQGSRGAAAGAIASSVASSTWAPVFLDFQRGSDSSGMQIPDLATLAREAAASAGSELLDSSLLGRDRALGDVDALKRILKVDRLRDAAAVSNPEAVILYGRCLETGIFGSRDAIAAMEQYIRAMYIDAMRAYPLLVTLARQKGFLPALRKRALESAASSAKLVLAELTVLGLDREIGDDQCVALLRAASESGHAQASVQLGLLYQSGRIVTRDTRAAEELWRRAADAGSAEAAVRIAAAVAFADDGDPRLLESLDTLRGAQGLGSVIAQVALASCSERGRGMPKDEGTAARGYRLAAARGSRLAYAALKRMVERRR